MDLVDTIRAKIIAQGLHHRPRSNSIQALLRVLDKAWWVSGEYGLKARIDTASRSIIRRIQNEGVLKLILNNAYRICTPPNYLISTSHRVREEFDTDLLDLIKPTGKINRIELASLLNVSLKQVDIRVKREVRSGNLISFREDLWFWQDFISEFNFKYLGESLATMDRDTQLKTIILLVLERYPYLHVEQIAYLSQIHKYDLARPLSQLTRSGEIKRGITINDSPDELFLLEEKENEDINWEEVPYFVLEKRDALVEILKLERDIDHRDGDYWIFTQGLPQAEFNLNKIKGRKRYKLGEFRGISTATLDTQQLLLVISEWAKQSRIYLEINIEDEEARLATRFVQLLQERGYQFVDESLILRVQEKTPKPGIRPKSYKKKGYTLQQLGGWYREKQFLTGTKSIEEIDIIKQLVQVDEVKSIAYRKKVKPEDLVLGDLIYTYGINFRTGFTTENYFQDILLAYPKIPDMGFLDRKIEASIGEGSTTNEIVSKLGKNATDVKRRLQNLERSRVIRRDTSKDLSTENCLWIPASYNLKEINRGDGKRNPAHLGNLLVNFLSSHIPLTLDQLSQFFGYTPKYLEEIKNKLLRRGEIVEGYYLQNQVEAQISTPKIIEEIEEYLEREEEEEMEDDENEIKNNIDILPFSDPIALLFIKDLLMKNVELQPTKRYHMESEWWIILWSGVPIGYLVKIPTNKQLVDYDIDIKIVDDMLTNPVISGIIQQLVNVFKHWFDDELNLVEVNGIRISDERFETLHFLISTLGIQME
ncbi:MAG: hypothetical protein GPJ54_17395 [Candidatus Heimdallarchaeota archaeon]|nr:hypothetical protein [Candidatus Heimdallarchaeota archaeon]